MRARENSRRRRGASLVETGLTLTIFLSLCVGTIDLAVGVYRQHVLTEAARQAARVAAVHGANAKSTWNGGSWGPSTFSGTADTSGYTSGSANYYQAQAVSSYLMGLTPSTVNITMTWPDGNNSVESRVKVHLTSNWTPIMTWVFGSPTLTLAADSQMPITH